MAILVGLKTESEGLLIVGMTESERSVDEPEELAKNAGVIKFAQL